MKKGKHTEEQIIGVLKQVETGRTVKDVARKYRTLQTTSDARVGVDHQRKKNTGSQRAGVHQSAFPGLAWGTGERQRKFLQSVSQRC